MMTIDHERLRSSLQKLLGELRAIKSLDAIELELLRQLDADIEGLLQRDGEDLQPDHDSRQRLSESLAQVEASHPRVALLTRQMIDSLAYLGV